MSTYVVTGASRGIGFEILRQLSSDPKNTVVGIVRDVATVTDKVTEELSDRPNIHLIQGDLTSYDSLEVAAQETAAVTNDSIDYLIANGAFVRYLDAFQPIGRLTPKETEDGMHKLIDTNVIGNIHLYNLFLPLVLRGKEKKVICITSMMADTSFTNEIDLEGGSLYSASKAAMNVITAKFNVAYRSQGVLFLGICPGLVASGSIRPKELSPVESAGLKRVFNSFQRYAPDFQGSRTPEVAVQDLINVWDSASIEKGHGGAAISCTGTNRWL